MRNNFLKSGILIALQSYMIFFLTNCVSFRAPEYNKNSEIGIASWYGRDFHGKLTANGEVYDMYRMTAAHKFAPLGSYAVVENLENNRRVSVKINDRGPFVTGRIIDLSYKAAKALGIVETGTARVKVSFLGNYDPLEKVNMSYYLQVASFLENENAQELKDELLKSFGGVSVFSAKIDRKRFFRVCIGPLKDDGKIENTKNDLFAKGYSPIVYSGICGALQN